MCRDPRVLMVRNTDFLTWWAELEDAPRALLERHSEKLLCPSGAVIVKQGEPSDSMFVVMEGTLKVFLESPDGKLSRTLGYLSTGDLFGELGLIFGDPRSATVKATDEVKIVRIDQSGFDFLMAELPGFARFLVYHLTARFKLMMQNISHISYCTQLRGNLPAFELLAVFQTIAGSGRRGLLTIRSSQLQSTGFFFFENSTLTRARYNSVKGRQAIWQVAVDSELPGSFDFEERDAPPDTFTDDCVVGMGFNDLLMEAAMKKDLGARVDPEMRTMSGSLRRVGSALIWDDSASRIQAQTVWRLLGAEPQSFENVWRESGLSIIDFAEVLEPLVKNGLVAWQKE
jgi:CRP-like cAMP-binding protein